LNQVEWNQKSTKPGAGQPGPIREEEEGEKKRK
jgi:hypothetical protein